MTVDQSVTSQLLYLFHTISHIAFCKRSSDDYLCCDEPTIHILEAAELKAEGTFQELILAASEETSEETLVQVFAMTRVFV